MPIRNTMQILKKQRTEILLLSALILCSYDILCAAQVQSVFCSQVHCKNGATCSDVVSGNVNTFECSCPPSISGPLCDIVTCENSNPCGNFGTCMDGQPDRCVCPSGYVQPFCTRDCTRSGCVNGGICSSYKLCICPTGYLGPTCENSFIDITCPDAITLASGTTVTYVKPICTVGTNFFVGATCDIDTGSVITRNTQISCTCSSPYDAHQCSFLVEVNSPPVINNCPDSVTVMQTVRDLVTVEFDAPFCTDQEDVSTILVECDHQSGQPISRMATEVICTCTDSKGFTDSCVISLPVNSPPVILNCPSSVTLMQSVQGLLTIHYNTPSCTDIEDVATISAECNHQPEKIISCTSTRTALVCACTDSQGSRTSCSIIFIPENAPPSEPQCPSNMDVIKTNSNGVQVFFGIPTCNDLEEQTVLTSVCTSNSGETFAFPSTVTCTCTDFCGLTSSCSFDISVQGVQCPSNQFRTVQIGSSVTTVAVDWPAPNNPTTFEVIFQTHDSGDFFRIGETPVTYRFRDQASNEASCSFTVTVTEDCTVLNSSPTCDELSCHCVDQEHCNEDSGICSRSCFVFRCPAGLLSESLSKVNPQSSVDISCSLIGSTTVLEELDVMLSRNFDHPLDTSGIIPRPSVDASVGSQQRIYRVLSVTEEEDLYCVLAKLPYVIGRVNVTDFLYKLPRLSDAPYVIFESNTSVTVGWEAWDATTDVGDPPVVHYLPYYCMNSSDECMQGTVEVLSGNTLEFRAEDLEVDTLYEFSVAAVREGENGEGPRSPSVTVKTKCNVPKITAEATARLTSSSGVNVSWQLPPGDVMCSTGVTKFTVHYKMEDGIDDSLQMATVSDTSMRWFVIEKESLVPGANYSFFVTFTTDQESLFSEKTEESVLEFRLMATVSPHSPEFPIAAIGGAVGTVVLLILLLLVILVIIKRRKDNNADDNTPAPKPVDNTYDNHEGRQGTVQAKGAIEMGSSIRTDDQRNSVENLSIDEEGAPPDDVIYDNLPQPIRVAEFGEYFRENIDKFEQEFSILKGSKKQFDWIVAEDPAHKKKNRFKNMYTYDHSRVVLNNVYDQEGSDYYNASFIKDINDVNAYIASQAPNRASLEDFIRMIWEQHVTTIVMVANLFEDGKERCLQYWPETEGSRRSLGSVTVEWLKTTQCSDFVIRYFVFKRGKETREVQQLHFLTWPDKDTPEHGTALIEFVKQSKILHQGKKYPMLVHCSAGIGRTGTFICLSCMMDVLRDEEYIDVFGFVNKMRQNRINMVQTSKQYVFLYKCLYEYHLTYQTEIPVHQMTLLNVESHRGALLGEFELLTEVGHSHRKDTVKNCVGKKRENVARNRVRNMVPSNRNRVFLMSLGQFNEGDYINASYVKSFQKKDAFITTQSPLPSTIEDFWRMVYDVKSPLVVMLNQLDSTDSTCVQYWPDRGSTEYGNMTVTCLATERQSGYIQRTLEVAHVNLKEVLQVTHMQMEEWHPDINLGDMVSLIKDVDMIQRRDQFTQPIVIHCINGFERSAVMVAVKSELERIAVSETVNVFSTVKKLRDQHEHMLKNKDDYILCFHLLKTYLAMNESNYENSDDLRRGGGMYGGQ